MEWLSWLEINRAVFHLHQNVGPELAIQRHKLLVGALGPVRVNICVVDKGPPQQYAAVRLQRLGQHVGAIVMSCAIVLRPRLTLRARFDLESAKIWNQTVYLRLLFSSTTWRRLGPAGSFVARPPSWIGAEKTGERYTRMP